MSRRETIRRQDCDGTTRPHEIELHYFRCRTLDGTGRELVIESDSGFNARQRARMTFGIEQVEVEIIEGNPGVFINMVTQRATFQELARSQEILEAHPPAPLPSTVTTLPAPPEPDTPPPSALERLQKRAKG
jgi:hypothetical protein